MPIGILFWVLMILWVVFFGLYLRADDAKTGRYGLVGNVLLFILLGLLGWRVFGPVLQ